MILSNPWCFLGELIAVVQKAEEPEDVLTARKRLALLRTVLCELIPAKPTTHLQDEYLQ